MSNNLTVISNLFESTEVRATVIDNVPWFVGVDVATALGYKNTRAALKKVWDSNKQMLQPSRFATPEIQKSFKINNFGVVIINEAGVYQLIFGSKLDSAKRFQQWVFSEVLPSIRTKGYYVSDQVLREIAETNNHRKIVRATMIDQLRKVWYDSFESPTGTADGWYEDVKSICYTPSFRDPYLARRFEGRFVDAQRRRLVNGKTTPFPEDLAAEMLTMEDKFKRSHERKQEVL